jgi:hypothetical protein
VIGFVAVFSTFNLSVHPSAFDLAKETHPELHSVVGKTRQALRADKKRNRARKMDMFGKVWEFFDWDVVWNKSVCKICGVALNGRKASNCKEHLLCKHKLDVNWMVQYSNH